MPTVCHNTYWTEWSLCITRTCVAQDCTSLCPKTIVIHVSCLVPCRTWHWPQAQVLSHLPHLSFRRSLPHTQVRWRTILIYPAKIHGSVADQHKSHLLQVMSPIWSSPKSLSLEELSMTGILGQIRIKHRKELWELTAKILSPKIRMNLEKSVSRCPTSSHRCTPIMTQRKALQTRILKMENYEKCRIHRCICRGEGLMNLLENQNSFRETGSSTDTEERSKCTTYSIWSLQKRKLDVKFISRAESIRETGCKVFVKEQRTGEPARELHFLSSLIHQIGEDLFSKAMKIICSVRQAQSRKIWTCEARTPSRISQSLYRWASATSLCSMMGITGRTTRICWISTRTSSSTGGIIYEGKSSPRYSDPKYARIWRHEESSRTTNWRILNAKIQRKSWDNTEAHFAIAGNARTDEFYEWFRWVSKSGIKLQ